MAQPDLYLSQKEIYILVAVATLLGMGTAFAVISLSRDPDMKAKLGPRIAMLAVVEGLCLMLVIFALLVLDL